jgi:hypothetical protein
MHQTRKQPSPNCPVCFWVGTTRSGNNETGHLISFRVRWMPNLRRIESKGATVPRLDMRRSALQILEVQLESKPCWPFYNRNTCLWRNYDWRILMLYFCAISYESYQEFLRMNKVASLIMNRLKKIFCAVILKRGKVCYDTAAYTHSIIGSGNLSVI